MNRDVLTRRRNPVEAPPRRIAGRAFVPSPPPPPPAPAPAPRASGATRTVRRAEAYKEGEEVVFTDPLSGRRKRATVTLENDDALIAEAIAEIQSGRRSTPALAKLLELYLPFVHKVAMRQMRGDKALADDVVQGVAVKVMQKLPSYTGERPLTYWLRAVARNVGVDTLRKGDPARAAWDKQNRRRAAKGLPALTQRPQRTDESALTASDYAARGSFYEGPERAALRKEREREAQEGQQVVRDAAQKLSREHVAVLRLRHPEWFGEAEAEGMSHREVAEALGIPPGTAMRRLHDAKKKLELLSGVSLPRDPRGRKRRQNPGFNPHDPYSYDSDEVIYVETVADVWDLYEDGLIEEQARDVLLDALEDV